MYGVSRESVPTVLLMILAVVAIGFVGATIDSVAGVDSGQQVSIELRDNAGGPDTDVEAGAVEGNGSVSNERQSISLVFCVEFLTNPPAILGILFAVGGILYGSYRRLNVAAALLIGTGVVPVVWASYFLMTNCGGGGSGSGGGLFSGTSVVSNQGGLSPVSVPPTAAAAVLGLFVVAGAVALFRVTGEDETFEPIEEETPEEPDASDFAAAAGRAADRIEDANVPVDNAVYRAWLEMTSMLDIDDPKTTTPRGFAAEAVAVGLGSEDVSELTELFNEVRYGGQSPEGREDRAVETLRRIEQTYRDGDRSTNGEGS
jgi:hypothetical protein